MAESDGNLAENVEKVITELHAYLHSEMSVSESEEGSSGATITVRNDAPYNEDGGQIVFTGVGLRIIDGSERSVNPPKWTRGIQRTRPSDQDKVRQRYREGVWVRGVEFEAETNNEQNFGETLFPGESVVYEMQIPNKSLPSIEIRVEGAVSRRHLFHFSKVISGLEKWVEPAIAENLRALNTVDIRHPLITATNAMPDFGSKTTLEEVNAFKGIVEEAKSQIQPTMQALNEVYHSAPNQELRDHMKQNVGHYLTSLEKTFTNALDALASGNAEQMREAADSLSGYLSVVDEVTQKTSELMAQHGVSPGEVRRKQERPNSADTPNKPNNPSNKENEQVEVNSDSEKQPSSSQEEVPDDNNDYEGTGRTPNDDRSDSMNPNNDAYQASMDNRSDQMNPNNPSYHSSRGR